KYTVPLRPVAAPAGTSPAGAPESAPSSAVDLPSPVSTYQTRFDVSSTGSVSDTRSGGGLGESRTATAARSTTAISSRPGKSEAMWPSGPTPRKQMANDGK